MGALGWFFFDDAHQSSEKSTLTFKNNTKFTIESREAFFSYQGIKSFKKLYGPLVSVLVLYFFLHGEEINFFEYLIWKSGGKYSLLSHLKFELAIVENLKVRSLFQSNIN